MADLSHVVSVIPTLQEESYIERCIRSLMEQTYPSKFQQILVVDGGSTDGTIEIVQRLIDESAELGGPEIKLINNPQKFVPHARNLALNSVSEETEFVFEMNAHAYVDPLHLEKRIKDLLEIEAEIGEKIAGVGTRVAADERWSGYSGIWIEGAISSPLGHGGGQFSPFEGRHQHHVPAFVIHRKEALLSVGGWGEKWTTNQDSDLSMRLINAGWQLWRSDVGQLKMAKRDSLTGFTRMMFRYGAWRGKSIWAHPKRANPLEFLPLIGLLIVSLLFAIGNESPIVSPFGNLLWSFPIVIYLGAILLTGILQVFRHHRFSLLFGVPLCLVIMHTSFTTGLIFGLLRLPVGRHDR